MKSKNKPEIEDSSQDESGETNIPDQEFSIPNLSDLQEKNGLQLNSFNELLETLSSTEDKQKSLWRLIFENANTDRLNAYIVWLDLYSKVHGDSSGHAIHGQNLSRYMERMAKANDQFIKLAELVGNAKKKDNSEITEDSIYEQMENESSHLKH